MCVQPDRVCIRSARPRPPRLHKHHGSTFTHSPPRPRHELHRHPAPTSRPPYGGDVGHHSRESIARLVVGGAEVCRSYRLRMGSVFGESPEDVSRFEPV